MSYPRKRISGKSLISISTTNHWIPAFAGMTHMWDSNDSDPFNSFVVLNSTQEKPWETTAPSLPELLLSYPAFQI